MKKKINKLTPLIMANMNSFLIIDCLSLNSYFVLIFQIKTKNIRFFFSKFYWINWAVYHALKHKDIYNSKNEDP